MNVLRTILNEMSVWVEAIFIRNLPGRIGFFVRRVYWSLRFRKNLKLRIETGCIIVGIKDICIAGSVLMLNDSSIYAENSVKIIIGDDLSVNCRVMIDACNGGEIRIGKNVSIGPNVVIRASNHRYRSKSLPIKTQGHTGGVIIIGDDVWIGANCVILSGAVIGEGSVIGAGAVVNKGIPPYSLAGGVPAKVIKENCRE